MSRLQWLWRHGWPRILVAVLILGCFGALYLIQGSRDERCDDICGLLKHKKAGVTRDVCVCEDPDSGERQAYPFKK